MKTTILNYEQARVWWIPQVPMSNPFHVTVKTEEEVILILNTLAQYDLFQLQNNIKPDFSNAGGLEVMENGEWSEYYDEDGMDIDEIMNTRREEDGIN